MTSVHPHSASVLPGLKSDALIKAITVTLDDNHQSLFVTLVSFCSNSEISEFSLPAPSAAPFLRTEPRPCMMTRVDFYPFFVIAGSPII